MPPERWPDVDVPDRRPGLCGCGGAGDTKFIRQRRDLSSPPGDQAADFTEYCFLYREAWTEPAVRWLLSVVPTAMIFDDHDVHDDWNISAAWLREYQAKPWWQARIGGAYLSYWLYQHLGNLSPAELGKNELWRQVQAQDDATAVLSDFAARAGDSADSILWSYRRSFGRVRVVVIDSRGGRVLEEGCRRMVNAAEWQWITESVCGDWDHLVLATSLPVLLPRGIHALEACSEAVCAGAWGTALARGGERVRRAADLEHSAAFGTSFTDVERLLTGLATGAHGQPPASITVVSGDIHHSYLAAVDFPAGDGSAQPRLPGGLFAYPQPAAALVPARAAAGLIAGRELIGMALARLAGVRQPGIRWRITRGPWFDDMLAALEFDGRKARIRLLRTPPDAAARLQPVCETELS